MLARVEHFVETYQHAIVISFTLVTVAVGGTYLQLTHQPNSVPVTPTLTPSPTVTPSNSPTPTPSLTPTPTPKPTPKPTPRPTSAPASQPTAVPTQPVSSTIQDEGYAVVVVNGFTVNLLVLNLDTPGLKIYTDTEEDNDCSNNCRTNSLAGYVGKFGGFAGINGTYFCPPDYASCAGETNSFHQLVKNTRLNKYINSARSSDSPLPIIAFYGTQPRLFSRVLDFPKDADASMSNYPILIQNGQNSVGAGNGLDTKLKTGKGPKGFIGWKGRRLYLGHVLNATVPEEAVVAQMMGLDNALNLDGGGSSALFYNGYKEGPGRSLPNAIVFIK